jgi:hypothetical protein
MYADEVLDPARHIQVAPPAAGAATLAGVREALL